jgi:Na+/proline symporter
LLLVALIGTGYTLIGGMWSVTLTDAVQVILLLVGLVILAVTVVWELGGLGDGLKRMATELPPEHLTLVPVESTAKFMGWLGLLAAGALGNMPGQDLMQRLFAAKSESVARNSCYIAGTAYLLFGAIPVFAGLAANLLVPDSVEKQLLPALASMFLQPAVAVIFVVALMSAVLSTIDSAILSPATVLAQNVLDHWMNDDPLRRNRICVALVAACSLAVAWIGESAWSLLEESYTLTLVGLFVPMMFGLFTRPRNSGWPALASMFAGAGGWLIHLLAGWDSFLQGIPPFGELELPVSLCCTVIALAAWMGTDVICKRRKPMSDERPRSGEAGRD